MNLNFNISKFIGIGLKFTEKPNESKNIFKKFSYEASKTLDISIHGDKVESV